ncbi:uncharacterized protein CTRU02_213283 [Colletotrichum truncatum]|uniref:Uncharacterized protein n=1 Tax=Colletotrichum truncatum TaxID=5467 RepID=A0ACC3YK82_COLTU
MQERHAFHSRRMGLIFRRDLQDVPKFLGRLDKRSSILFEVKL